MPVASTNYTYQYFRVLLFILDAVTAILFLVWAFSTQCAVVSPAFHTLALPPSGAPFLDQGMLPTPLYPVVITPTPSSSCGQLMGSSLGYPATDHAAVWCASTVVPRLADHAEDMRSLNVGSSWNVLLVLVVLEWISASYSLLFLQEPSALWQAIPMPPGIHPVPFLASVWNLTLLVLLWVCRSTLQLPDNNLLLYSALLVKTVILQNYLARASMDTPSSAMVDTRQQVAEARNPADSREWRTDNLMRQRSVSARGGNADETLLLVSSSSSAPAVDFPLHSSDYASLLDCKGEAGAARMMRLCATAPLLLTATYLVLIGAELTWSFQIIFISMLSCHAMGIPLQYLVLMLRTAAPAERPKLQWAGWLSLVAAWLSLVCGLVVYAHDAGHVLTVSGSGPNWVTAVLWLVLIYFSLVWVLLSYYFIPLLCGMVPLSNRNDDRDPWLAIMDVVVFWLDLLGCAAQLGFAWTVYWSGAVVTGCGMPSC